jgi:hypothetical protein
MIFVRADSKRGARTRYFGQSLTGRSRSAPSYESDQNRVECQPNSNAQPMHCLGTAGGRFHCLAGLNSGAARLTYDDRRALSSA